MGFCSQFRALFKKNFIAWHRSLCGSLCELLFPVVLMFIIVLVRYLVPDKTMPARNYQGDNTFAYYFDNTADTSTWLGLSKGQPFGTCMYYKRFVFAIVAPNDIYTGLKNQLTPLCNLLS